MWQELLNACNVGNEVILRTYEQYKLFSAIRIDRLLLLRTYSYSLRSYNRTLQII